MHAMEISKRKLRRALRAAHVRLTVFRDSASYMGHLGSAYMGHLGSIWVCLTFYSWLYGPAIKGKADRFAGDLNTTYVNSSVPTGKRPLAKTSWTRTAPRFTFG